MKPLSEFATDRYNWGAQNGCTLEPWDDPGRDFVVEAAEELADAANYVTWSAIQLNDTDSRGAKNEIDVVLENIRRAYHHLDLLQKLREAQRGWVGGK
jgi:hypothetical protein